MYMRLYSSPKIPLSGMALTVNACIPPIRLLSGWSHKTLIVSGYLMPALMSCCGSPMSLSLSHA
eukprot:11913262-Ditylum_brightwellii.AAC.1